MCSYFDVQLDQFLTLPRRPRRLRRRRREPRLDSARARVGLGLQARRPRARDGDLRAALARVDVHPEVDYLVHAREAGGGRRRQQCAFATR